MEEILIWDQYAKPAYISSLSQKVKMLRLNGLIIEKYEHKKVGKP